MMSFARKNSRPGVGTPSDSGRSMSSSSSSRGSFRRGRSRNGEALAGAEHLVHGIMGQQAEVDADTCKEALEKYYVLEAQTKRLAADLQKSQRNRMSSAQLARLKSEANQTQWTLSNLECDVRQKDYTIKRLENRIRYLEEEIAVSSASQSVAALEEKKAAPKSQQEDDAGSNSADSSSSSSLSTSSSAMSVSELESKNAQLVKQVHALQSENATANNRIETLEGQVERLKDEQRVTAQLNTDLKNQLEGLQDDKSQPKLLGEGASRITSLEQLNLELEDTVEQLRREVHVATESNTILRRQIAQQQGRDNDQDQSQGALSLVDVELSNWEFENQQDDDSCSADESRDDNGAYECIVADLRRQSRELQEKIKVLEEEKSVTAQRTLRLRAEDAEVIADLQDQTTVLENQLCSLRDKQNALLKGDAEFRLETEEKVSDMEREMRLLEEDRRVALKEIESLKNDDFARLEVETRAAELQKQVELLEEEKTATHKQLEHVRDEKHAAVSDLEKQVEELKRQLDKAGCDKNSTAQSVAASLPKTSAKADTATNNYSEQNSRVLQAQLSESEKRSGDLAVRLEEADKKIVLMKTSVIPSLENLVEDLTSSLHDCQEDNSASRKRIEVLSSQLEEYRIVAASVPSLQDDLKVATEDNKCLSAELQSSQARLLAKSGEIEVLVETLESARTTAERVPELENTVEKSSEENRRLKTELESCRADLEIAKDKILTLSMSLDKVLDNVGKLEHHVEEEISAGVVRESNCSAAKSDLTVCESQTESPSSHLRKTQGLERHMEQTQTLGEEEKTRVMSQETVGEYKDEMVIRATGGSPEHGSPGEDKNELSATESDIRNLSEKLQASKELAEQLDRLLDAKSSTNRDLAGRLAAAATQIRSLSLRLEETQVEAARVTEMEVQIKERDEKVEHLEEEIRSSRELIASARSEITALSLTLKDVSKVAERVPELEKSTEQTAALKVGTEALRLELEEAKKSANQVSGLKQALAETSAEKRRLDCELQVCRVELGSAKLEVKRISALVAESRNKATRAAELEACIAERENEKLELEGRLSAAETVIMSLSTRLEKTRDQLEGTLEFQRLATETETQLKETSSLLETRQADLSKAESEIRRLTSTLRDVQEKAQRVDEAECALKCKREENQELEARLAVFETDIQALLDQSGKAKELQKKTEDLQSRITELQCSVRSKEDENLMLVGDLEECQTQLTSTQRDLENATEKLEELGHASRKVEELETRMDEQSSEIATISLQLEECRADLSDAWDENSKTKLKNESLIKELAQCHKELNATKSESESLSAMLVDTRVRLSEVQAQVSVLKASEKPEKKTAREVSLETQLNEARTESANEIRSMQDRLEDLEDQLTFTDEKNQAMQRELAEMQQKLLNVQTKNRILGNKNVAIDRSSDSSDSVAELSEAKAVLKRQFDEVREMRRLVQMKNDKIAALVQRVEEERQVSEDLRFENSDFGNRLFDAESEVSSLKGALESIQKIVEGTEKKNLRLETENARLKATENELEQATETIQLLRGEIADMQEDPRLGEGAGERILKMQEQIDCLEREKRDLSAEIDRLRLVDKKSKQNIMTIDSLRQELRNCRVKEEQKFAEVQSTQRSHERTELLQQENEKLRADIARLEESEKRFTQYSTTVDLLRRDIMETNAARVRELQAKVEALESDNKVCRALIDDLKVELSHEQTDKSKLMDETTSLKKSLSETSRGNAYRISSSVAQKQDVEEKFRRLYLKHEELLQQYDNVQNQLSDKLLENSKQAENITHLKESLEAMEKANARLQSQVVLLKEAEQLAAQDCAHVSALEKKLAVAKARVEEAEQVIDEFAELEEQLHQATLDNERMHEVLDQFRSKLAASEGKNAEMAKRLNEYECQESTDTDAEQRGAIASLREELEFARKQAEDKDVHLERLLIELENARATHQKNEMETEGLISALRRNLEEAEEKIAQAKQGEDEDDLLNTLQNDLEVAKAKADRVAFENEKLVSALRRELDQATEAQVESDELIFSLRCELEEARSNSQSAEQQAAAPMQNVAGYTDNLEKDLKQKELEIERLREEAEQAHNTLTASRSTAEELEHELKYSRAKLSELSDILKERGDTETDVFLQEKCMELAQVSADRDLLRQKLKTTEAKAQGLEQECEMKKNLVQELSQSWDVAASNESNVARLQEEYDLSLKRATDLSVQLAESRMKIDELTEEVRKARQRENEYQTAQKRSWQNGFSKNLAKALAQSGFEDIGHAWLTDSSEQGPKKQNTLTTTAAPSKSTVSGAIVTADGQGSSYPDDSATIRKLLQQIEMLKGERNAFEASLSAYKSQLEND